MQKKFPTLYKKTSKGAIQLWEISVKGPDIIVNYGQKDGKIQTTVDTIKTGKNIGKANETTPESQAVLEAEAQWTAKKKKGYVEKIDDAAKGKVDTKIIEGGINPMLAQTMDKAGKKITYPLFIQPKLDGHRCIATYKDGKCLLWSRTRKTINSVPHINKAIKDLCIAAKITEITFDGELYNHSFKNNFEVLTSFIRPEEPREGAEKVVQYHIYDLALEDISFEKRINELKKISSFSDQESLYFVDTKTANNDDEVATLFENYLSVGYEGAMARLKDGLYEFKRSFNLIKIKEFMDSEFQIIGYEEGRGKLQGSLGAFVLKVGGKDESKTFNCKMSGSIESLKEMWVKKEELIGKFVTVKYQGLTADGIPRFPVGIRIREDF